MAKLGESLVVIGAVGVAGYLVYSYFTGGAQAKPQGALMITNLRNPNVLNDVNGFTIDGQVVDVWTCSQGAYLMLDVGVHSFGVDWGDPLITPLLSEFVIVENTCLVIESIGQFSSYTTEYGCIPYSFKCVNGVHYRCNSLAQDVLLTDGCEGTWYQPPEV